MSQSISRDPFVEAFRFPDPVPEAGWVRATMISTADGAAVGPDGRSGSIGTPADAVLVETLRGLADVVLVGAQTVRTEGYRLPDPVADMQEARRDAGQEPSPLLAVVSASCRLPAHLLADAAGTGRLVVFTTEQADATMLAAARERLGAEAVVASPRSRVLVTDVVKALAARGLRRIQCEGGPSLLAQALAERVVRELSLTVSPRVLGGDAPRVVGPGHVDTRLQLDRVLPVGDTLFTRWLTQG